MARGQYLAVSIMLILASCTPFSDPQETLYMIRDIPVCGTNGQAASFLTSLSAIYTSNQVIKVKHPRLAYADDYSGYPRIRGNDNRMQAGTLSDGQLHVDLEVGLGELFMENTSQPGLRLVAVGEKGKDLTVPGPLIRVETGTVINATLYNTLKDSTITVFGLQTRPAPEMDSLFIAPGESKTVSFQAGDPGTYLYYVKLGAGIPWMLGEEDQVAGAFIIDPIGGSPPDRVFVMNIFSEKIDTAIHNYGYLESLTINGKSWPFTERLNMNVGDTIRWRVINASQRVHPMHLHGFYYHVLSRGGMLSDKVFKEEDSPLVVTETLMPHSTISMEWVPSRQGKWLFHCHLSFHVTPDIRLPGGSILTKKGHVEHMSGLVLGLDVNPGGNDLIFEGEAQSITLVAEDISETGQTRHGFSLINKQQATPGRLMGPGPLLILKQYQPTYITVQNEMSIPTSIHWHGLEIDSWSDGVPGYSASDGKVSPVIYSGEKFTYKLALMRAGSFIYHSHLDDIDQLTRGLYGPMIVLGENETYDPETDHFYIIGWKSEDPRSREELDLNGGMMAEKIDGKVGESHRLRLMHIAPAGLVSLQMIKDGKSTPLKIIAKDGADLPGNQQDFLEETPLYGVGETADFEFNPSEPGIYELKINYDMADIEWIQTWHIETI